MPLRTITFLLLSSFALAALAETGQLPGLLHAIGSATIGVREGIDTKENYLPGVVALRTHGMKFNEKKGEYESVGNICTGSVFNRQCVVTSSHCVDENPDSIDVFDGPDVNGSTNPVAKGLVKRRIKEGTGGNDLIIVRLDRPVAADKSFYSSKHLPSDAIVKRIHKEDPVAVVGYGANGYNPPQYDKDGNEIEEEEYTGTGVQRAGIMKLQSYDSEVGFLDVVPLDPGKKSKLKGHLITPGDSGGPLIWTDPRTAQEYVLGVAANLNHHDIDLADKNQHVATFKHMKWLLKTLELMGCTEEPPAPERLADLIRKKMKKPGATMDSVASAPQVAKLMMEASNFNILTPKADMYSDFRVRPFALGKNGFQFVWEGFLAEPGDSPNDPYEPTPPTKQEFEAIGRVFGLDDWTRPRGMIEIPYNSGVARSYAVPGKLPRPRPLGTFVPNPGLGGPTPWDDEKKSAPPAKRKTQPRRP